MSSTRRRSRPLNISLCLLAASVIAACGGGGDPSAPVISLSASSEGRTAIATAYASSDSADIPTDFALPTAPQESVTSATISNNGETASGATNDIGSPESPNDLSVLPATSAGPLAMGNPVVAPTPSRPGTATVISPDSVTSTKTAESSQLSPTAPGLALTGSASLAWKLPATRADGSAIGALSGYRIYYGTVSGTYSSTMFISGGAKVGGVVTGLGKGKWYFAVATVDASGNESGFGYEMSKSL